MTEPRAPAGGWRTATIRSIEHPTPRGVAIRFDVPDRVTHFAGQHYVIRLTAADGYTAQRSYSIASAPSDPQLEFYIERLDDGEVSGYLANIAEVGDELEIRGPIGGWFVWTGTAPALCFGGGSGVVPLISMLRHAADIGRHDLLRIAVSSRTLAELPYSAELIAAGAVVALTREAAAEGRAAGRLTAAELEPLVTADSTCFVCGSAAFSLGATTMLTDLGVTPDRIRVESFGPTS